METTTEFQIEPTRPGAIPGNILVKYTGNSSKVIVPDGVTEIGMDAFAGNAAIEEVVFPEGLQVINSGAFDHCRNLKTFNVPASLGVIAGIAFAGCLSLRGITLPETVTFVERTSFIDCLKLEDEWRARGLCPLCGSKLQRSFFKKTCKRCHTVIK